LLPTLHLLGLAGHEKVRLAKALGDSLRAKRRQDKFNFNKRGKYEINPNSKSKYERVGSHDDRVPVLRSAQ
jgi:hypothetical protein